MSVAEHSEKPAEPATGRALVPFVARPMPSFGLPSWRLVSLVAAFGLAAGVGGSAAYGMRHGLHWPGARDVASLPPWHDQVTQLRQDLDALRRVSIDGARTDDSLRRVQRGLDTLGQDVDRARAGSAATIATVAALSAKIDRLDHDPSQKLADIAVRLDRLEKQASAAAAGSQASLAASVSRAQPLPLSKPVAAVVSPSVRGGVTQVAGTPAEAALPEKPATVGGWVLRDVYDGMALVEGRGGGLREVEPGEYLPGAGQVRSIERRGRSWVVLTSRGVIDKATF